MFCHCSYHGFAIILSVPRDDAFIDLGVLSNETSINEPSTSSSSFHTSSHHLFIADGSSAVALKSFLATYLSQPAPRVMLNITVNQCNLIIILV